MTVDLNFIAVRLQRILHEIAGLRDRLDGVRDDILVLTTMATRQDNASRRMEERLDRYHQRLNALESKAPSES